MHSTVLITKRFNHLLAGKPYGPTDSLSKLVFDGTGGQKSLALRVFGLLAAGFPGGPRDMEFRADLMEAYLTLHFNEAHLILEDIQDFLAPRSDGSKTHYNESLSVASLLALVSVANWAFEQVPNRAFFESLPRALVILLKGIVRDQQKNFLVLDPWTLGQLQNQVGQYLAARTESGTSMKAEARRRCAIIFEELGGYLWPEEGESAAVFSAFAHKGLSLLPPGSQFNVLGEYFKGHPV